MIAVLIVGATSLFDSGTQDVDAKNQHTAFGVLMVVLAMLFI